MHRNAAAISFNIGAPISGLVRGRSFRLRAPVRIDDVGAEGVLYAQGNRTGGQVLYLAGQRLHYVCSLAGREQHVVSDRPISLGEHVFGMTFAKTGATEGTFDVTGEVELFIDEGSVSAPTEIGMLGLDMMQTVSAGRSVIHSVSADFASPYPLGGATLHRVVIDFTGDGEADPASVVDRVFARD